jgi:hypothetical protein
MSTRTRAALALASTATLVTLGATPAGASTPYLGPLHTVTTVASTVPGNGDVNPYGVAVVRQSAGRLHKGSVLISNFNAASNAQGTGTTIVEISPGGQQSLFADIDAATLPSRCPGGVGLTTALAVLDFG